MPASAILAERLGGLLGLSYVEPSCLRSCSGTSRAGLRSGLLPPKRGLGTVAAVGAELELSRRQRGLSSTGTSAMDWTIR